MSYKYICDRCNLVLTDCEPIYKVSMGKVDRSSDFAICHLCGDCATDLTNFLSGDSAPEAVRWKQVPIFLDEVENERA